MAAKFKVLEDCSLSNKEGPDTMLKAGVYEANEKNREALERLAELGFAERMKTADKEE